MDEEIDLIKIISEVLKGKSLSRALFDIGKYKELKKYVRGEGYTHLEKFVYRREIARKYIEVRQSYISLTRKFESKVKSLRRKVSLLNLLIVFILSALSPFITFFLSIKGMLNRESDLLIFNIFFGDVNQYLRLMDLFSVLQITLVTYLLNNTIYYRRKIVSKLILYLLIYYLISMVFRSIIFSIMS